MKTLQTNRGAREAAKALRNNKGFTLIEMMIATVVFSVGMMAIFVLQLTSINAYSSARDVTQASDTIDRLVSVLKTEIEQSNITGSNDSLYAVDAPFGDRNLEQTLSANPWDWVLMTPEPLNETFQATRGRFCVWARGGFIPNLLGEEDGSAAAATPVDTLDTDLRLHIAVVYPSSQQEFSSNCQNIFTTAGCSNTNEVALLAPDMPETDPANPRLCGLRVIHASTIASIPVDTVGQP